MSFDALLAGSPLAIALAPVAGAYLLLSAAGMLKGDAAASLLADLRDRPAAMHAIGATAFLVGAFILALQRHWHLPADIVLNLVAGWWAFEGAGMLASPARIRDAMASPRAAVTLRRAQVPALLIGLYLVAAGITGASA